MEYISTRVLYTLVGLLVLLQSVLSQVSPIFTLLEEREPNTQIVDIITDFQLEEKFPGKVLEFSFLEEQDLFKIQNGVLMTSAEVDRDLLCPYLAKCVIPLDIRVGPDFLELIKLSIEIQDINDNTPTFIDASVDLSLKESASIGTRLLLPTAQDTDSPRYGIQTYSLLTPSETFEIQVTDIEDGTSEVALVLLKSVDRETQSSYSLNLRATDGGDPAKYGSLDINIEVLDVNDNSPVFVNKTYSVTISERTPEDTIILQIRATDKDSETVIKYGLNAKSSDSFGHLFHVDELTGEISVTDQLDFEDSPIYVLTVTAQDSNPDGIPATAKVTINLVDSNDNAPVIKLHLDSPGSSIQLSEAAFIGNFVAHITVIDPDSGDNGLFECSLDTELFELQRLYPTEYKIITSTALDREAKGVYDIEVTCRDNGNPQMVSKQTFNVNIMDENDNSPQFDAASYSGTILEGTGPGLYVTQVRATDNDIGANGVISYSFEKSAQDVFRIDPKNGTITTRVLLDFEDVSRFQFKVFATDHGTPARISTVTVVVSVIDTDDEKPEFIQESFTFAVYENGQGTQEVGTVQAHDADSELFNSFTYDMQDPQQIFHINPETGVIITQHSLDRETTPLYTIVALAIGTGIKPHTSSATVTIYVADENDHAPTLIFPTVMNNTLHISNRAAIGEVVSRIKARDEDAGQNAQMSFSIVSGNDKEYFDMDHRTGAVSVVSDLTHIENQAFGLIIKVQDEGQPPKDTEAFLNIIVNQSVPAAGDAPHIISSQNLTIVIVIACVSGVIMVVLLVAIVAIVRQQRRRSEAESKYNQVPRVHVRPAVPIPDPVESSGEGSKKKKEVSFDNVAMDMEYTETEKVGAHFSVL